MAKIEELFTHIDNVEDRCYLRNKLPDVNMRIFHNDPEYAHIIDRCCHLLEKRMEEVYDDFDKPLVAMSAANCGIGFNIIVIADKEKCKNITMINPEIALYSHSCVTKTNCRSIRLPEKVRVKRYKYVTVTYYDLQGQLQREEYNGSTAFMIQHEIDHNNGILITDKVIN